MMRMMRRMRKRRMMARLNLGVKFVDVAVSKEYFQLNQKD